MRQITEIYESIKEEELYTKDRELLTAKMDIFREEEKERILAGAMDRIQKEAKEHKEGKRSLPGKKRLGILILAAALFTALTASAAGYLQLKKELADSLNISEDALPEQLSSMLTDFSEEEASVTVHGVTVRAEQAICDGRAACICFEIELPEGVFQESPDKKVSGQRIRTYWNGPVSWSWDQESDHADIFNLWRDVKMWIGTEEAGCGPMLIERSTEDPDRYYVIEMVGLEKQTDSLEGPRRLKLELTDLGYVYADHEKTEWITQTEGTWTLEWTMEFNDLSRIYEIEKAFQKGEKSVFIQSVQVSPLGICVTGTTESEGVGGDLISPDGILHRDASAETEDAVSVWAVGEEDGIVTVDGTFEKLMDVDDIIGLRLNGEELLFSE